MLDISFFLFFFFWLQLVRLIERFGMRTIDHDYYIRGGSISRIYPVGRDLYARSTIDNSIRNSCTRGLETCGYSWHEKRWFRSVAKIEPSILSRGWKLDGRMETYMYMRNDRRQQCGYLYVIRIDYLMSGKVERTPPWLSHAKSISVPRLVLRPSFNSRRCHRSIDANQPGWRPTSV